MEEDKILDVRHDLPFIDYFLVCGLSPENGLEPLRYTASLEEECKKPPMERSYTSSVLAYFPERRPDRPFYDEVLALCLPGGLRFCTQKDLPAEPQFHNWVSVREDGARVDGCALLFYERVDDGRVQAAMHALHTAHVRELTGRDEAPARPVGAATGGCHTLPRRGRADRRKRTSYYDCDKDELFAVKCIALVTRLPVVRATDTALRCLHGLVAAAKPPSLPLESLVFWLLHEVPLPLAGSTVKATMAGKDLVCQRPSVDELPFFDYPLRQLFDIVSVDHFLRLFSCFLLEHQILLCSKELRKLSLVAESLVALAFPFRWQHVYVPILPFTQALFLEAPLPFLMGLQYADAPPDQVFQSTVCVFDIDTARLDMPEDMPPFPDRGELCAELQLVMDRFAGGGRSRREEWNAKRMSRSFDDESASALWQAGGADLPPLSRRTLAPLPFNVLQQSESLARVQAIAKKAGVSVALESLQRELESSDGFKNSPSCRQYFQDMKFNNAVREIFLTRFTCFFYSYDHFVIGGSGFKDRDSFLSNRDSMQNFDKASFLSDQPNSHVNFLAAFIETQMFASFVDWKILSQWEAADPNLSLFDRRIQELRDKFGQAMVRTPTYEATPRFAVSEALISKREDALDYVVSPPHALGVHLAMAAEERHVPGCWPTLDSDALSAQTLASPQRSPWKQRHRRLGQSQSDETEAERMAAACLRGLTTRACRPPSTCSIDLTPAQIAQTNWKFVEQLLHEAKGKTKRMLVEKMGREAVELGHTDLSIIGIEENTLVAGFCDLLERIWAHGLLKKQSKSALWTHLVAYQEMEKGLDPSNAVRNSTYLSPELQLLRPHPVVSYLQTLQKDLGADSAPWSTSLLRAASFICERIGQQPNAELAVEAAVERSNSVAAALPSRANDDGHDENLSPAAWASGEDISVKPRARLIAAEAQRKRSLSRPRSPDLRHALTPLPTHITYDLKNVLRMTEIKTDIGYARAFVRLALERKLLHSHLKALCSSQELLRKLYKRYAFMRNEDEKEQFLFHILSLNAADFRCFTNTFTQTKMQYQALLVLGGGRFTLANTGANIWIRLGGSLRETTAIRLPKNTVQFTFEHRNLGVLSTLRIGHEHGGDCAETLPNAAPPKWFLEEVIVRNEVTGQAYRFACARWFGRGVDDGSLERLLIAESIDLTELDERSSRSRTPTRARSPSTRRTPSTTGSRGATGDLEQQLGDAVNSIVKHFYRHADGDQRSRLTRLLCGERGLVRTLEQCFLVGFRSSRFFRQHYPWDYVERVCVWFAELFRAELLRAELQTSGERLSLSRDQRLIMRHACQLVGRVGANATLGKEGKFQAFVLLCLRDHILPGILPLMAWSSVTATLYDESSIFRTPRHLGFVTRLLAPLNDYTFELEPSLTFGLDATDR